MNKLWQKYRFLLFRRVTQVSLLFLYFAANAWAWKILQGNLSSSLVLETIPLSDPFAVLQMFFAGALLTSNIIVGAVIITVFYALVGGRVFCSWVCPVNMITDLANFLRRKLKLNQIQKKQPANRKLKFYILAMSLILSYVLGVSAFEFISPISMTHRGIIFSMGLAWAGMLILFLFDLFILKNGWCGHLCPLGAFYSVIGKFSLIRVKHDEQKCTVCMKCKEVCPESQVLWMVAKKSTQVLSADCTNCGRCVEVCDDEALNFSIRSKLGEKNEIS